MTQTDYTNSFSHDNSVSATRNSKKLHVPIRLVLVEGSIGGPGRRSLHSCRRLFAECVHVYTWRI